MKRVTKRTIAAVALLAVLGPAAAYGWHWLKEGRYIEATDNAYVHGDITAIGPKVAGYVAEVLVDDNEVVEAGTVLFRIVDDDYHARVDRAQAAIAQADAAAENLARRKDFQRALIREADAAIDAARADIELADRELARAAELVGKGWTPRRNHDAAKADAERATAVLARTEAVAAAARAQLAVLDSEGQQIDARRQEARARLQLAEIALDDTVIRAPVSGVIGNRRLNAGEYVRPGAVLMSIVPVESVWVVANFKETQAADITVGQVAHVTVDGYPDVDLKGRVDSLAPASGAAFSLLPPDNATGNFVKIVQRVPVKIELPPDHPLVGRLVPGLSVGVTVDLRSGERGRSGTDAGYGASLASTFRTES
ncbi:MAG TPA: HlyD family secretion protein [Alphaproteobacteria bacterium]|nr:HlyD family secretion protein [Alphaproteobacteria bacterium]